MLFTNEENQRPKEVEFLNNLKEDLRVLKKSWEKRKLQRKKVAKHFIGILDSVLDIVQSESLEPFEHVCIEVREFGMSVASGKTSFDERLWGLSLELMDVLEDSLREGAVAYAGLQEWQSRWKADADPHEGPNQQSPDFPNGFTSPIKEAGAGTKLLAREESEMVETRQTDAEALLQKAQEALSSGNGEDAKELALKAAKLIAELEAEEAKKKGSLLRADLETAVDGEAEAEEALKHLKEEMVEREQKLASLDKRLADAQSAFEERERASHEIKQEIDKIEAELASLNEQHKHMLDQYQEALPARDAADRECSKLRAELEKLGPEVETMSDSINAAESQLAHIRGRRAEIEAELEKLGDRISA